LDPPGNGIQRLIDAAIKSARKQGLSVVEVKITDTEAILQIPLNPADKTVANDNRVVL
jgi:hypothetical protein